MKITVQQLKLLHSPLLTFVLGDEKAVAFHPKPPEQVSPGALVYVSTPGQLELAVRASAGIIIAARDGYESYCKDHPEVFLFPGQALFLTTSVPGAMALVNPAFEKKRERFVPGKSPLAQIHPTAKIGESASIGPFVYIGEGVEIGDRCQIGPHCLIEKGAKILHDTILHGLVYIGEDCELGHHCEIHPQTCIGADGFGYTTETDSHTKQMIHRKVPQIGSVIIGDHVEIGSCSNIDRGTLVATRIGSGTKVDSLAHIGHNCRIGINGLMAAGFLAAGSCEIGDNFTCGGDVSISDHVKIVAHVTIGAKSTVIKSITQPGSYVGYPLQPWQKGVKTLSAMTQLADLRYEVLNIRKVLRRLGFNLEDKRKS